MHTMHLTKSFQLVVFITILGLTFADLPPEVKKCHAGDVDCIANTINEILRKFPKGNPELGLNPIDSIFMKDVVVAEADSKTAIQMDFKFKTLNIEGFENATITRVVGFDKDLLKSKFEIYGRVPLVRLVGEYETEGKILLLPIRGNDNAEIFLKNATFSFKAKLDDYIENGKQYGKLKKLKSKLEVGRLVVRLDNLMHQKDLSDSLNEAINSNWQDVWNELRNGINGAVSDVMSRLMSDVLKKLPYDDLYRTD